MEITAKKFPSFVEVLSHWEEQVDSSAIRAHGQGGNFVKGNSGIKARLGIFPASDDGMSPEERAKRFEILKENRVNTLLTCHECIEEGDNVLIAHQLFTGIPLSLYLEREWRFGEREIQEIIVQILIALESIHARSLVHGRLMLENVLYDHEHTDVRLIGFLHIYEGSNWGAGRRRIDRYLAPEFYMFNEYSYASEIYSIAIMMMELLNGKRWLENLSDDKVISYQVNKGFRFPKILSSEVSKKLRDIIEKALNVDADGRFESLGEMRQAFYGAGGAVAISCDVPREEVKMVVEREEFVSDDLSSKSESSSASAITVHDNSGSPELSSSLRLIYDPGLRPRGRLRWKKVLYLLIALALVVFFCKWF